MDKIVQRALAAWIEQKRNELHPRILRLIELAKWDLHYGPNMEGQDDDEDSEDGSKVVWPGFSPACYEISTAISELCSNDVWIDIQSEEVLTSEPTPGEAYEDANPDYDPEDEDSEETITVQPEVCWEDFRKVDGSQIKSILLGELASYCN